MTSFPLAMQALALLGCLAPIALATSAAEAAPEPLRFVLIPKVTHPWFEAVREGAEAAARMIEQQTDTTAVIEYRPPPGRRSAYRPRSSRRQFTPNPAASRLICWMQIGSAPC
jgi:hypothetical protein